MEPVIGEMVNQPIQLVETDLPADDRSDHKRLVAALGETLEAPPDHLAHTLRDADAPALTSVEQFRSQLSLLNEEPDDFGDEEGVAFGLRMDCPDELGRRRDPARGLDE